MNAVQWPSTIGQGANVKRRELPGEPRRKLEVSEFRTRWGITVPYMPVEMNIRLTPNAADLAEYCVKLTVAPGANLRHAINDKYAKREFNDWSHMP